MNSALQAGNSVKDNLLWLLGCIFLPLELYYLCMDMQYNNYLAEYKTRQAQEVRAVRQNITDTLSKMSAFTELIGKRIQTSPENYQHIQVKLLAGQALIQDPKTPIPMVQSITYYKLTAPKAVITPSMVAPLRSVPSAFNKSAKNLRSVVIKGNGRIEILPLLDSANRLIGVLEVKIPSIDIQKFVGADKMTTLKFPSLFSPSGKQMIQEKPLEFSLIPPLSYIGYFFSHPTAWWLLACWIFILCLLVALSRKVLRKQLGIAYGAQIGQLRETLETVTSSRSSLEARNSFQEHLIGRLKEGSRVIHKVIERFGHAYRNAPLSSQKKQVLIREATALIETLSQGMPNYERKPIIIRELLDHIKLQVSDKMRELNITWTITCPKDLTFIGDPLFTKQILLHAIGYPLYHMPKNKEVFISVTRKNGFVTIEARDHRFALTDSAKTYLSPPENFIEDSTLRQICAQHNIGYESYEIKEGVFYTKVSFPLSPVHAQAMNVLPSPSAMLH